MFFAFIEDDDICKVPAQPEEKSLAAMQFLELFIEHLFDIFLLFLYALIKSAIVFIVTVDVVWHEHNLSIINIFSLLFFLR